MVSEQYFLLRFNPSIPGPRFSNSNAAATLSRCPAPIQQSCHQRRTRWLRSACAELRLSASETWSPPESPAEFGASGVERWKKAHSESFAVGCWGVCGRTFYRYDLFSEPERRGSIMWWGHHGTEWIKEDHFFLPGAHTFPDKKRSSVRTQGVGK